MLQRILITSTILSFYCMLLRHVHYWLDKFSQLCTLAQTNTDAYKYITVP